MTRKARKPRNAGSLPPLPALVPQPQGGALLTGGVPGNRGGPGRPPVGLKDQLRGAFARRIPLLETIADGEPVQKLAVPLALILAHAHCPKCGGDLKPTAIARDAVITVEGRVSASPNDRIRATDTLGKYASGPYFALVGSPEVNELLRRSLAMIEQDYPTISREVGQKLNLIWNGDDGAQNV